jgi:ribosomal protein L40E
MNEEFITLCREIVKEKGKDILNDQKLVKALLMDYSQGKYKNEINLLLKTIELGYPREIDEADDIDIIRLSLSRRLTEENYIIDKIAISIISLLVSLIKGNKSNVVGKSNKKPAMLEVDKIKRSLEIWICGRCNTTNDFDLDFCKKCGKEFNPPL